MGTAKQYFSSNFARTFFTFAALPMAIVIIDQISQFWEHILADETYTNIVYHDDQFSGPAPVASALHQAHTKLPMCIAIAIIAAVVVAWLLPKVRQQDRRLYTALLVAPFLVFGGAISNYASLLIYGGPADFIQLHLFKIYGLVPILIYDGAPQAVDLADIAIACGIWLALISVAMVVWQVAMELFRPSKKYGWGKLSVENEMRGHGGMIELTKPSSQDIEPPPISR